MTNFESTAPWVDGDPAEAGQTIGRFDVLGPLGQGGMGIVLAAYDRDLGRKVALKLLRDVVGAGTAHERLLREARAMAKLSHPNVLAVYEVGTIGERAFIAMKYADGGTLRVWCAAAARTWSEIRDAYVQAGRGLAAAHAAGLVHRDFKPENALVTDAGVVCVADFGLVGEYASATSEAPDDIDDVSARLTRTGAVMGTPAYMAPEQHARGETAPAADQFAFCVSLWEALYGTRPFAGTSRQDLASAADHASEAKPPADTDVPTWLCDVLRRGLAREPAARWRSMDALLAALARDPAAARRRRMRIAASVVVGAVAIGATTYAATRWTSTTGPGCDAGVDRFAGVWDGRVRAELAARVQELHSPFAVRAFASVAQRLDQRTRAWQAARRDACEATRVRKEQSDSALDLRTACLDRRFDELAAFIGLLRTPTAELLDHAAAKGIEAGDVTECADATVLARRQPLPSGPAGKQIAELESAIAGDRATVQANRRIDAAVLAARIHQAESLAYAPVTAAARFNAGLDAKNRNAYAEARAEFEQALPLADAGGDDALRFQIAEKLTQVVGANLEQFADGLRYGSVAAGILPRLPADPLREASLQSILADVYWRKGELPHATELAEKAVAIGEKVAPTGLETADYLFVLAALHIESDDPNGAITLIDRSASLIAADLGTDYPAYASCLNIRGSAERRLHQLTAAEADLRRAIEIYRASRGDDCMELGTVYTNMGSLFDSRRDYAAAIAQQRLAVSVFRRTLGADATRTLNTELRLGDSLSKFKQYDEGGALLASATAGLERSLGKNHPYVANGYQYLGNHDRRIDKLDDALVQFHTAEQIWIAVEGKDTRNLTRVYQSLGDTYDDLHRPEEAIASYEAALAHIRDDATGGHTRADLELSLADVIARAHPEQAQRAHELALTARAQRVAFGASAADIAEIDDWLVKHPVRSK